MKFVDIDLPYDEAENYLQSANKEKFKQFFYKGETFDELIQETTYFIVGDKGSGKTAYSAYFCNNEIGGKIKSNIYQLSVDDYNKIIQMKSDHKLDYTHYITLWKAIILIKICSCLNSNDVSLFGKKAFGKIEQLLKKYNFTNISRDVFSPVSFMDNSEFCKSIDFDLKGGMAKPKLGKTDSKQITYEKEVYYDNWVSFINEISEEIIDLHLSKTHYLFIDGIDSRPSDIDFEPYSACVYPLIRAVYEVNATIFSKIRDRKKGRLQIILLTRLDIFLQSGLSNPGSKLEDNCAYIDWNTSESNYRDSKLFTLVNKMISQNKQGIGWDTYFNFEINRGRKQYDSFVYFLRLTTGKPRDFVKVLRITQNLCKQMNVEPKSEIIEKDEFQKAYSTYFIDKIRTALSFTYKANDIEALFDFLRTIGKYKLKKCELENSFNSFSQKERLIDIFGDFYGLFKVLFDYDLLCVEETDGIYRWKYKETTIATYNYSLPIDNLKNDTKISFNWALEKGFSMYLKM